MQRIDSANEAAPHPQRPSFLLLQAICCNLVYSPFQAAGDAGSLKASVGGPVAVNGDSSHSPAARDIRQDSAVSVRLQQ